MSSIKEMLGETGAKAVEAMLAGASRPAAGFLATVLGLGALLFAAIGVVVQLKDALNVVWEVEESEVLRVHWRHGKICRDITGRGEYHVVLVSDTALWDELRGEYKIPATVGSSRHDPSK